MKLRLRNVNWLDLTQKNMRIKRRLTFVTYFYSQIFISSNITITDKKHSIYIDALDFLLGLAPCFKNVVFENEKICSAFLLYNARNKIFQLKCIGCSLLVSKQMIMNFASVFCVELPSWHKINIHIWSDWHSVYNTVGITARCGGRAAAEQSLLRSLRLLSS